MYELKGLKAHQGLDGESFIVNVYTDGRRIGAVSNDGNGGPNHYDFSRADLTAFTEAAREWAKENGEDPTYPEITDIWMGELLAHLEYQKTAKKNAKRGLPITVVLFENPQWLGDTSGKPAYYAEVSMVGARSEDAVKAVLERYHPHKHLVVRAS